MATTLAELREHLADPLAQLPSPVKREYRRGQIIYSCHEPSTSIYLLVAGKVKLSRVTEDGRRVVVDIYQTGELFGESAFLNSSRCEEEAIAHREYEGSDLDGRRRRGLCGAASASRSLAYANFSAAHDRVR